MREYELQEIEHYITKVMPRPRYSILPQELDTIRTLENIRILVNEQRASIRNAPRTNETPISNSSERRATRS